jgi:hypothetical protein
MMKLICEMEVRGEQRLVVLTTASTADHGELVKNRPGVGKPYWIFSTIPDGKVIACDFTDAPLVVEDASVNQYNIDQMPATPPLGLLTYE